MLMGYKTRVILGFVAGIFLLGLGVVNGSSRVLMAAAIVLVLSIVTFILLSLKIIK